MNNCQPIETAPKECEVLLTQRFRLRWPRGKHNGLRIVGVRVQVVVNVRWWSLTLPSLKYGTCLSLGPLHIWLSGEYDYRETGR